MDLTNEKIEKRENILNAAKRCFARFGFQKTTLDDIAAAIGMKKASLYHYYKNKEALFDEVVAQEADAFFKFAEAQMVGATTAIDKLRTFTKAKLVGFRNIINFHQLPIQVILEMQPLVGRGFRNIHEREIGYFSAIIDAGIQTGELRQCDVRRCAGAILAIIESLRFKAFQEAKGLSTADVDYEKMDEEIMYILDLLIDGIKV